MQSIWPAVRQAYHQHHATCPQCRAAGAAPSSQQRCPEGLALWDTYNQSGDPPHIRWAVPAHSEKPDAKQPLRKRAR